MANGGQKLPKVVESRPDVADAVKQKLRLWPLKLESKLCYHKVGRLPFSGRRIVINLGMSVCQKRELLSSSAMFAQDSSLM